MVILLALVASLLIPLAYRLHTLQPELVAAQQQRVLSQQEAEAARRNQPPTPRPCSPLLTSGECDQTESARRDTEIDIQGQILRWTRILAIAGIVFGILQGVLIYLQSRYTGQAAEAASTALLLTHRPQIVVREIEMPEAVSIFDVVAQSATRDVFNEPLEASLATIASLNASFRITNIGGADATMHHMGATVFVGPRLPHINPAIGKGLGLGLNGPIKPGYTTRIPVPTFPVSTADVHAIRNGEADIFVVGKLIYFDNLKNFRRTGFARRFDLEIGRFRPVENDTDYEYEE